jgi:type IV pilus assembly protein PilA
MYMLIAIRERLERSRGERGFTLIELMVVVLIIAILIAIAIPTFLGARRRAQDKQAQSNLRNGLTAQKAYYVDNQAYAADDDATELAALQGIESSLSWDSVTAATRGVDVTVPATGAAGSQNVVMESDSASARIFCLADLASGTDAGTWYANAASGGACPAVASGMAGWNKDATAGWRY